MTVWDTLVGQRHVVELLQQAVAGHGLTQSWLFTGPPGSGRSNSAVAFAAALECDEGGCGVCQSCRTVLAGTHPDVRVVRSEKLSLGIDEVRELVRAASLTPSSGRFQIIIIEDADRLTEQANNALLKALEEPGRRTIFMLSAPTAEDLLPTIRSRCRLITLTTPTASEVARFLESKGIDPAVAGAAARASQGHIGRAMALARDDALRTRRDEVIRLAFSLTGLGPALAGANRLIELTKDAADVLSDEVEEREFGNLKAAFGVEDRGRRPREYGPALRNLEKDQKTRRRRRVRDAVDGVLTDLITVYRDAIALAVTADSVGRAGAEGHVRRDPDLVNEAFRPQLQWLVDRSTPELNLQRVGLILTARDQLLRRNVDAQLVLEALLVQLARNEIVAVGA